MKRCPHLVLLSVTAAGLMCTAPADAQTRRMMVVEDNGAGPQFMHFSGPSMRDLREPDFVRDDLPIFERRLALDEAQKPQVRSLLEGYLESFMGLVETTLPKQDRMAMRHEVGDNHFHGDVGMAGHDEAMGEVGEAMLRSLGDEVGDFEFEGGAPGQVMIAVVAGGGPGGPDGPGVWMPGGGGEFNGDVDVTVDAEMGGESPQVVVAFDSADGAELTDEQIKKLEEHAKEIAERIESKMANAEMDGEMMREAMPMGIEERQAQFDRMRAMAEEMEAGKKLLRRQFIGGVQATLRPDQLDRWPSLDRALTRKKSLPKGRLDGERTDLVAIAEDLELTEAGTESVLEQLHAYEITLHDALTRRNAFLADAEARIDLAVGEGNPEDALDVVDRATQMRVAVRSVNDQFAAAVAGHLDPQSGESFRETVKQKSYPSVYRQTPGLKIFEKARQIEGLDERTLVNILEVERLFRTDLEQVNDRLVDAIRKHQPLEPRRGIEHMQAAMNGELIELGNEEDPIRELRDDRRKLEARYVKQLHALLSPEQVATLPALPKRRRGPIMIERSTAQ